MTITPKDDTIAEKIGFNAIRHLVIDLGGYGPAAYWMSPQRYQPPTERFMPIARIESVLAEITELRTRKKTPIVNEDIRHVDTPRYGETLRYPELPAFLAALRQHGLTTDIYTNGLALDLERQRLLIDYGDVVRRLYLTMPSLDPAAWAAWMGATPQHFATLIEHLDAWQQTGADWLATGRVLLRHFAVADQHALAAWPELAISERCVEEIIKRWPGLTLAPAETVDDICGQLHDAKVVSQQAEVAADSNDPAFARIDCQRGRLYNSLVVDSDGYLQTCDYFTGNQLTFGQVDQGSIARHWIENRHAEAVRDSLHGPCRRCVHSRIGPIKTAWPQPVQPRLNASHYQGIAQRLKNSDWALPISIGILSWRSPETLRASLLSYRDQGLLAMSDDICIYFQEINDEDRALANEFGLKAIGSERNIGISGAFAELANVARHRYFLPIEHDWLLVEPAETTLTRLTLALELLKQGVDVVRLRHRRRPGFPIWGITMRGYELDCWVHGTLAKLRGAYLLDAISWVEDPEISYPQMIHKLGSHYLTTSRFAGWTNNTALIEIDFYRQILQRFHGEGIALEHNMIDWWSFQSFVIAHGEGLFCHCDRLKYPVEDYRLINIERTATTYFDHQHEGGGWCDPYTVSLRQGEAPA